MQLRRLRYFLVVAELENFHRAAERCHIAVPALSRQIRFLEDDLGVQLFDRLGRRVKLSPAGIFYLEKARALLRSLEDMNAQVRDRFAHVHPPLRLGISDLVVMKDSVTGALRTLRQQFGTMEISIHSMSSAEQCAALRAGKIDGGLLFDASCAGSDLRKFPVMADEWVLAMSADHPLAGREHIRIGDLIDAQFAHVTPDQGPALFNQLSAYCKTKGLTSFAPQFSSTANGVLALLSTTRKIAFWTRLADVPPTIVFRNIDDFHLPLPLSLVIRGNEDRAHVVDVVAALQKALMA